MLHNLDGNIGLWIEYQEQKLSMILWRSSSVSETSQKVNFVIITLSFSFRFSQFSPFIILTNCTWQTHQKINKALPVGFVKLFNQVL